MNKTMSITAVLLLVPTLLIAAARPAAVLATTETSTASGEVAVQETTVKLRERLQKILGDQDDADGVRQEKAAYIGAVTRISDEAITLKTLLGSEIIPLETSTILLKRTQRIPASEVVVGNWLIVIGTREKNRSIKPELLLVQTTDLKPREHMVTIGAVSATTGSTVTVVPRGKTDSITLSVTKNSKLVDATGEKMTIKDIPKDIAVIVVGFATTNGWELGTLKSTVSMAEYKSAATPTPSPAARPRATAAPTPESVTP